MRSSTLLIAALTLLLATAGRASAQDFSGTWDVYGNDPVRGPYLGTAVVAALSGGGYSVEKLTTFQAKLPSGQDLVWAWNATARNEAGGLRVDASLRRAHIYKSVGKGPARTAADQTPLALTGLLLGPGSAPLASVSFGTQIGGNFVAPGVSGPTETWTCWTTLAPTFPITARQLMPAHAAPSATVKKTLFALFGSYHQLPQLQPYVARPDFQAAIHQVWLDSSGLDFYRARGTSAVLVLDKVADDIAVAEETRRASAFSRRLFEKAKLFEDDTAKVCADANGMVTSMDPSVTPPRKNFGQSPVLVTGTWVLSQLYRWQATQDQEAFDNVVRGVTGAAICVDISTDKTQFARAIDFLANATPGQVGVGGKYSWAAGTGKYSNLMWMLGGNNDMLHGIEVCLSVGAQMLPATHALRAQVGAQAASLLNNVSIAQKGTHEIFLSYAAWTATQDPQWQARYTKALGFRNVLDKLYMTIGGSFISWQGIGDWSGHNLGAMSHLDVAMLGGATPNAAEQSWRATSASGARLGFGMSGPYRNGILAAVATQNQVSGGSDVLKTVLTEIPYPKNQGDVTIDFSISQEFSLSPYPSDPWKVDWMKGGRIQALTSQPYFYRGADQNYWNRGPLDTGGGPDLQLEPGQDYLLVYWLARQTGALGPND